LLERWPTLRRLALAVAASAAAVITAWSAAPAGAAVTPTRNALELARAIEDAPGLVTGAEFTAIPLLGNPAAVSSSPLGQFPVSGETFAILGSGDTSLVERGNDSPSSGADNGGPPLRGAQDVTTLRLDFTVPPGFSCATIAFRFFSEEFPEFVGRAFNDAFIAELDESTWASPPNAPGIRAPKNFAFDLQGNPINVNSLATVQVTRSQALGTTYDAATRRLRASTPVTPGPHSIYLTVFDQGDRIYDSAVFVDGLTIDNLNPCTPGAALDLQQVRPAGIVELASGRLSIPASSVYLPERLDVARILAAGERANPLRDRRASLLRLRVRDTRDFLVRGAQVRVTTVPFGLLRPLAAKRTGRNGEVYFRLQPTARLRALDRANVVVFVRASKPGAPAGESVTGHALLNLRYLPPR
jgi:hypothetical protein